MNEWRKRIWVLAVLVVVGMALGTAKAAVSQNHSHVTGGLTPRAYLPLIQASCDGYFFDNFSDPNSGWPVGPVVLNSQQLGSTGYVNGEYLIDSDPAGAGYLFRPLAPAPGYENYQVEAEVRFDVPTADGLVGLIFGAIIENSDVPRYYLFEIEPEEQEFRLIRREDATSIPIVDYTPAAAIHQGTAVNHLSVLRSGAEITLVVNGTTLGTWSDSGITGPGYTGLALRVRTNVPQANAFYDNFYLHTCVPGANVAAFNQAARPLLVDSFGDD